MNRRVAAIAMAVALTGCMSAPVDTGPTNNKEIRVDRLFTHDGCTVYRFYDGGTRYFVRCDGASRGRVEWTTATTVWTGKAAVTTYHPHSIETVR